jgi:hypothetical protein
MVSRYQARFLKSFMKKCGLFMLLLTILCSGFCYGQNTVDTAKISFIKTQFAEINKNLKSYKRIEKTDTAETTEGNGVLLYYKGSEIKKIAATYYGETGKALQEYYFFNKKLIFCYCVDYHYNKPFDVKGGGKIASTTEERFYLDNDKILMVKKRPSVSEYFSEFPTDPRKEGQRLLNLK